ncbi:hypothetical protein R3P38DRAFT_3173198 [Favolaschia claudopus]|uniref:Uncharacterized protein n=1 Tax=Favolaschia claudopus TaxID=2862362 RepID=A0AAW0DBS4_9AGAR
MPRAGTAEKRRKRAGKKPAKPGKVGWVHGTKLAFFEGMREDYIAALETKRPGKFYTAAAHAYLKKYGYNTPWEGDLEEDEEVAADVDPDEDVDSLSPEEGELRAKYLAVLRSRIGVWFNGRSFKRLFDKKELEPPPPVKARILNYYSHHFYAERIKPRVVSRLAALSRMDNPPAVIKVRNQVTKEAWLAETPEFRAEVMQALEKEHEASKQAYETAMSGDTPSTPAEYNVALSNAAFYLQPFADAIHDRFGMNVAIMLCGPIADHGGNIEVRSVHAGFSNGLVPRIWTEYDRAGFDSAQRSFVAFTHQCFTEEECRARALPDGDGSGAGIAATEEDEDSPPPQVLETHAAEPTAHTSPASPSRAVTPPPPTTTPPPLPPNTPPPLRDEQGLRMLSELDYVDFPLRLLEQQEKTGFEVDPMWLGGDAFDPPVGVWERREVGASLAAEIAAMGPGDALEYMDRLGRMSDVCFEMENMLADTRGAIAAGEGYAMPPVVTTAPGGPPSSDDAREGRQDERGATGATAKRDRPVPKPAWRGRQTTPEGPSAADAEERGHDEPTGEEGGDMEKGTAGAVKTVEPDAGDDEEAWEHDDEDKWPAELTNAVEAFKRLRELGGGEWAACVRNLVTLERKNGFVSKGGVVAPQGGKDSRPIEVPAWMSRARKWEKEVTLTSVAGPASIASSFADRWWIWWKRGQPEERILPDGSLEKAEVVSLDGWEDLAEMTGKNGFLLYVGGLLWWGEAVSKNKEPALLEDWKLAVREAACVLALAVKAKMNADASSVRVVSSVDKSNNARPKRTRTSSSANKENVEGERQLRKRARAGN